MINTFILLALPNLVVTPKITFQLHVVYGEEAKIYLEKIGFSEITERRYKVDTVEEKCSTQVLQHM